LLGGSSVAEYKNSEEVLQLKLSSECTFNESGVKRNESDICASRRESVFFILIWRGAKKNQ
jgi:hypothetical protein